MPGGLELHDRLQPRQRVGVRRRARHPLDRLGRQFVDLCLGGFFRLRLFCEMRQAPNAEEIERNVASAVRVFLNTYGAGMGA